MRRQPVSTPRLALATFAGLSLLGVVTGCTSEVADASGPTSTPVQSDAPTADNPVTGPGTAESDAATDAPAAPGKSKYADGQYTEVGDYSAPGFAESIKVELTLADDVVTAVTVTPQSKDPNGKVYEAKFAGGISAVVVGKNIDDLKVSKVAGSSLTSDGFNTAIKKIKADAAN